MSDWYILSTPHLPFYVDVGGPFTDDGKLLVFCENELRFFGEEEARLMTPGTVAYYRSLDPLPSVMPDRISSVTDLLLSQRASELLAGQKLGSELRHCPAIVTDKHRTRGHEYILHYSTHLWAEGERVPDADVFQIVSVEWFASPRLKDAIEEASLTGFAFRRPTDTFSMSE